MTPIVVDGGGNNDPLNVTIDIKPGNTDNPTKVNIDPAKDKGVSVAILSTHDFDASMVDWTLVRFGRNGTEASSFESKLKDKNGDGRKDLVVKFYLPETGLVCGDTVAKLTGKTKSGQSIVGSGAIITKGCK